jgi:hypothetical protein
MYGKIVNPITGKKVSINTKLGQKILKNYIDTLIGGDNLLGEIFTLLDLVIKTKNYTLFYNYLTNGMSFSQPDIPLPYAVPQLNHFLSRLPEGVIKRKYGKILTGKYNDVELLNKLSFELPLVYGTKKADKYTFYWCIIFIIYLLMRLTINKDLEGDWITGQGDDGDEWYYKQNILNDEVITPLFAAISQFTYILARGTSVGNKDLLQKFVEYNNDPIRFKSMNQFVNKELQPLFVYRCSNNYGCGRCIQISSHAEKGVQIVFNSTTQYDDTCIPVYTYPDDVE